VQGKSVLSLLQCVVMWCSVVQYIAVCLQCDPVCCSALQCFAVCGVKDRFLLQTSQETIQVRSKHHLRTCALHRLRCAAETELPDEKGPGLRG